MKINFLILCFLTLYSCYSQTISGVVKYDDQNIFNAIVLLKTNKIQFTKTDITGNFEFKSIEPNVNISLEINAFGFETFNTEFQLKKDTVLSINLIKSQTILEEVIIKKQLNFVTKNDTTKFNIENYKDGSEKVVEDLLKKLPGIDVDKTGKIRFKGKEIEALMFDGDDLFDNNYVIGTKNIDVNVIEAVEAIENFNKNKVLKKVTDSDKVALNLIVKKSAYDYNLTSTSKTNFDDRFHFSKIGIMLSKQLKFFNSFTTNNIGIDNSPFFVFSKNSYNEMENIEKIKNRSIISETQVPLNFGNENALLNKNLNLTNTFLKNFNKSTKNTSEFVVYNDKINQLYETNSSFSNGIITNFNQNILIKPTILNISNKFEHNTNKLFIENKTLFDISKKNILETIENNGLINSSNLISEKIFFANKLEITNRLTDFSALNTIFFIGNYLNNQNLTFEKIITFNDNFNISNQLLDLNTLNLNLINEYYYSNEKFKFKIKNNLLINTDNLMSSTNDILELFSNQLKYNVITNTLNTEFAFKFNNLLFKISPLYNYTSLNNDNKIIRDNNILLNFTTRYLLSKKMDITANFNQNLNPPEIQNIYSNYIVQDFRTISNNSENLILLKRNLFNVNLRYSDYLNSIQSNFGFSYQNNINGIQNFNIINQNFVINKYSIINFRNELYSTFFYVHKYLGFIKSNIKFNINNNIINSNVFLSEELIPFRNNQINLKFEVLTSFKSKLNFTNSLQYSLNNQVIELNENKNKLTQINNEFKAIFRINNHSQFNLTLNYIKPDFNNKIDYSFLNFFYENKIYKEKINLSITGHNLLNFKRFENSFIFNQGFSNFSYQLIPRYLLLGISLKLI